VSGYGGAFPEWAGFPLPFHRAGGAPKATLVGRGKDLRDLKAPPGNRLEALVGDRAGQHSVRINDQWRLCFRFRRGDAYDVEIVDYH
jgi:toxin HigB-1